MKERRRWTEKIRRWDSNEDRMNLQGAPVPAAPAVAGADLAVKNEQPHPFAAPLRLTFNCESPKSEGNADQGRP